VPELSTELRRIFERSLASNPPAPNLRVRIAAAVAVGAASPLPRRRRSMPRELLVAAALLAFVGLLAGGAAWLRSQSQPARQVTPSPTLVPTQQALQPKPAAGRQCSSPCVSRALVFATATIGWISDGSADQGGPAFLYRTDDAGHDWQPVLSWDGPGAQQIRSSVDGGEALVVTGWGSHAATLFHTSDGGAHWTASGLPIGVSSDSLIYFLNPQEGWVLSADRYLMHTADSGRHWTTIGRVERAIPPGNAYYWQRGLGFLDSSFGWYASYALGSQTPYLSLTHDGGATWRGQALARPDGLSMTTTVTGVMIRFFDRQHGVVDAIYGTGATACSSSDPCYTDYVYMTSDGGAHWSAPLSVPGARTIFVDANHWFGIAGDIMFVTSLLYTSDAGRHWSLVIGPSSPALLMDWDIGNPIDFIDSAHGRAISLSRPGLLPRLLVTSDGGMRWTIAGTVPGEGWSWSS
jgi:photosystem II stability/assembly factor-like uncharacterized protein